MTECSLCTVANKRTPGSPVNEITYEFKNFILIPSIGPLDIGHFLIISKGHYAGLATMPDNDITDFFELADLLVMKTLPINLLFFEHGSYDNFDAGSCISHTHIHVIPNYAAHYAVLDSTLEIISKNVTASEINRIDFPYILTFNSTGGSRIYQAYNVHSQMMRKAICEQKQMTNWDWKAHKNIKEIKDGLSFWKTTLRSSNSEI